VRWWTRIVQVVLGRHDRWVSIWKGGEKEGGRRGCLSHVLAQLSDLLPARDPGLPQILAKDFDNLGRDISNDVHVAQTFVPD